MPKKKKGDIIEIPELNIDHKLIPMYLVGALVGTEKGVSEKLTYLRVNIVRLVDKAIDEYLEAKEAMTNEQLDLLRSEKEKKRDGGFIYTHTIINHLENCINSVNRFFKLYDQLKTIRLGPQIDRNIRHIAESHKKEIEDIRNTVEHIDEEVQKDQVKKGQTVVLWVSPDYSYIKILDNKMKMKDLASAINSIYKIGKEITQFTVNK